MDEFLKEIQMTVFKEWIMMQKYDNYHIYLDKDDNICLESKYGIGQIIFNPLNIIELKVMNKNTQETVFYLHFQMNNIKHALELFYQMQECILSLTNNTKIKVLLSCTGGLTTSYFVFKVEEAIKLLDLNIEMNAISYTSLEQEGSNYDIILLAPQISYLHAKVQEMFKDKKVINIPPKIYAKYDVGELLSIIINSYKQPIKRNNIDILKIKDNRKILSLTIYRNKERIHLTYNLYHQGNIIITNDIIKSKISLYDIYDALDSLIVKYQDIEIIALALPGILYNGKLSSTYITDIDDIELKIKQRYKQKVIITNDANAAVVGYYSLQDKYKNLMFLFQPASLNAGAGIIIDGKLIKGNHHFAGEVSFINTTLPNSKEVLIKMILSTICIIDPQVIVLFSDLINDVNELKLEIEKTIPNDFIPEIVKVNNVLDYILLGQMILSIQEGG